MPIDEFFLIGAFFVGFGLLSVFVVLLIDVVSMWILRGLPWLRN